MNPERRKVIAEYQEYLRHSKDAQLKDWPLITDMSPAERKVRDDYLAGRSNVIPFRGTGVERINDDQTLLDCQRKFTALFNEYMMGNKPMSAENFKDFFAHALEIQEELL